MALETLRHMLCGVALEVFYCLGGLCVKYGAWWLSIVLIEIIDALLQHSPVTYNPPCDYEIGYHFGLACLMSCLAKALPPHYIRCAGGIMIILLFSLIVVRSGYATEYLASCFKPQHEAATQHDADNQHVVKMLEVMFALLIQVFMYLACDSCSPTWKFMIADEKLRMVFVLHNTVNQVSMFFPYSFDRTILSHPYIALGMMVCPCFFWDSDYGVYAHVLACTDQSKNTTLPPTTPKRATEKTSDSTPVLDKLSKGRREGVKRYIQPFGWEFEIFKKKEEELLDELVLTYYFVIHVGDSDATKKPVQQCACRVNTKCPRFLALSRELNAKAAPKNYAGSYADLVDMLERAGFYPCSLCSPKLGVSVPKAQLMCMIEHFDLFQFQGSNVPAKDASQAKTAPKPKQSTAEVLGNSSRGLRGLVQRPKP